VQKLAIVDERLRISRDLHDGIIQSIYAVSLSLEDVAELVETDPRAAADRVDRTIDRLHTTIGEIRTFIVGLGTEPGIGIGEALETMTADLLVDSPVSMRLDVDQAAVVDDRLHPEAVHELIQIAREAVSNVARHSGAAAATLALAVEDDHAVLRVEDDGVGFDPDRRMGGGHFGLANLRDRAARVGGTLTIESEPGVSTRIIVRLPLPPESPA
jgi:signal transduction histidine kinase